MKHLTCLLKTTTSPVWGRACNGVGGFDIISASS